MSIDATETFQKTKGDKMNITQLLRNYAAENLFIGREFSSRQNNLSSQRGEGSSTVMDDLSTYNNVVLRALLNESMNS